MGYKRSKIRTGLLFRICYTYWRMNLEKIRVSNEQIRKKTPQELIAQLDDVYGLYGVEATEEFILIKEYVMALSQSGLSDEDLATELQHIYTSTKDVIKREYSASVRRQRNEHETTVATVFSDYINQHPLDVLEEQNAIEALRAQIIFLDNPEQIQELGSQFPGGNFLYHGTQTEQAIQILESGKLANVKAIQEAVAEQHEGEAQEDTSRTNNESITAQGSEFGPKSNSGFEGISWNYNEIGAMPGDRYHIAGFLAAPQDILSEDQQLAIPSRPAPFELIQINKSIDSDTFYTLKTQAELFYSGSISSSKTLFDDLLNHTFYIDHKNDAECFIKNSPLADFLQAQHESGDRSNVLKSLYSLRENGTIALSPELLGQVDYKIPVAAVAFQALIDSGRIRNVKGFENVQTVEEIIQKLSSDNEGDLLAELKKDYHFVQDLIAAEEQKVTAFSVPVSQLYLVVSKNDLESYLQVLARSDTKPKGILVYDESEVKLEHFASAHQGDHVHMTEILKGAIPPTEGYVDYEASLLGTQISPDMLRGTKYHTLGDTYLTHRKTIQKDAVGKLVVV